MVKHQTAECHLGVSYCQEPPIESSSLDAFHAGKSLPEHNLAARTRSCTILLAVPLWITLVGHAKAEPAVCVATHVFDEVVTAALPDAVVEEHDGLSLFWQRQHADASFWKVNRHCHALVYASHQYCFKCVR